MIRRSPINRCIPEDRRAYNQATQHSFKTLEPFTHEWRIVTPSGKVKWVQASSRPERRENGEVAWYGVLLDITDRKQVEEALRQSEATKNRMLRAMPDLLIWMTAEGTYIDFIEGSEINCFLSRAETVGKSLFEVLPAELAQQRMDAAQRALRTGEVQVYEQQFTLQGEIRYEEVRMVAIGDDKLLTIVRDVTDRKRAEAELEAQQVFLRQLIDVIPNPVFVKDAEGRFVVANRALAAIHHCTVDEILGKREPEFNPNISWAQMDQYLQSNREVMTTRRPKQNPPHLLKMVNGQQRWFQTLLSPFIDAENQVQGVVGNSVDVTDLKQVEEALQRQNQALQEGEERFRSAFRDAPIGMALIHLDDRWLRVNAVLCDMLGYSEAELLLINVSALVHPEDINKLQDCIEQVFATENRSAQVELRYCCCGGQIIWGMMSLSLVRNDQQQPLYYVAQIQDITEQHAIDRMKNEFISIVSHELRTPLTAIRGFLGLLNTGIYDARPEKAKRMIEQSLVNSDRLVRLVNDILDLERLSSGKVQLVMEVCEVQALMQRAVEGVQSIADGALVTLSFVPTAAQVWAAPDAIIQTLTNLLSNAIKFSPPEAIVTLAAQAQADSILFQVRDRGRGIPAEKLGAIFGRFQQVDVSDARQKGGTGLGLAICQSIVQQHGGSIWVESVLGEGSTFYFTLPVPPENQQ
jgi:PAS domain S-box-containing protein